MVANAGIIAYESFQASKPRILLPLHLSAKRLNKVTVEGFDRLMAVNARGTMLCYKHAGKQMIAQGRGGRIIGTHLSPTSFLYSRSPVDYYTRGKFASRKARSSFPLSGVGRMNLTLYEIASPVVPAYCASKFAIRGLTQAAGMSFLLPHTPWLTYLQLRSLVSTELP